MNRIFTPAMIETFRVCRRAYKLAFVDARLDTKNHQAKIDQARISQNALSKSFLLKALAEIHHGRITTVNQVQKYIGRHWPTIKRNELQDLETQEKNVQAFRFVFKALTHYVQRPYQPEGAKTVGVALKARSRIPQLGLYLEDTFDLINWYPAQGQLEFVDFHLQPLKLFDPAWPSPSLLVKQFLAQKLAVRWPFKKLLVTFCQMQADVTVLTTIAPAEIFFRLHWAELLKTVAEMKDPQAYPPHVTELCQRCYFLQQCRAAKVFDQADTDNYPVAHIA